MRYVVSPAESGDLDDLAGLTDMHNLESPTDNARIAKALFDLFWGGIGGDVEVFRARPQKQIPYRTADHKCVKTLFLQLRHHH